MNAEIKKDNGNFGSEEAVIDSSILSPIADEFESKYFYIYRVRGHGDPVKCYRIKRVTSIAYSVVRGEIDTIFNEIEEKAPFGSGIGDVAWRHKAYIVFILDDTQQKINNVEIRRKSGGINNSFLGGQIIDSVNGNANVSGFYCVNYMQSEAGGNLGDAVAEVFKVKIRHGARAVGGGDSIRGHEDSGTNLGPPLYP